MKVVQRIHRKECSTSSCETYTYGTTPPQDVPRLHGPGTTASGRPPPVFVPGRFKEDDEDDEITQLMVNGMLGLDSQGSVKLTLSASRSRVTPPIPPFAGTTMAFLRRLDESFHADLPAPPPPSPASPMRDNTMSWCGK